MASIGPQIPAHHAAPRSTSLSTSPQPKRGPSPTESATQPGSSASFPARPPHPRYEEEEEEEEDAYAPALPPDLASARGAPGPSRRVIGPAIAPQREEEEEESDEEIGPAPPPPPGAAPAIPEGVRAFMEREEQRRKAIEEAAKPKALQRDEWMLKPPTSSELLANIDPTKLNRPRQFSRSTAPAKSTDTTLWTETPAERQQRLADEVLGKKRRIENADPAELEAEEDSRKRRKRDAELKREVEQHSRKFRGASMLEAHADKDAKRKKEAEEQPPGIWDHSRDMSLGGRLMDEKDRRKLIQDARGLSERFGSGRSGGFL